MFKKSRNEWWKDPKVMNWLKAACAVALTYNAASSMNQKPPTSPSIQKSHVTAQDRTKSETHQKTPSR